MAVQANRQDDDHEETGQIGTQPQQRRAGDVLAQQTNHGDHTAGSLPHTGSAIAGTGKKESLAICSLVAFALTVAEREPIVHVGKGKRQTATCMNALHREAAPT